MHGDLLGLMICSNWWFNFANSTATPLQSLHHSLVQCTGREKKARYYHYFIYDAFHTDLKCQNDGSKILKFRTLIWSVNCKDVTTAEQYQNHNKTTGRFSKEKIEKLWDFLWEEFFCVYKSFFGAYARKRIMLHLQHMCVYVRIQRPDNVIGTPPNILCCLDSTWKV